MTIRPVGHSAFFCVDGMWAGSVALPLTSDFCFDSIPAGVKCLFRLTSKGFWIAIHQMPINVQFNMARSGGTAPVG